jgi:hypothetical protein
MGLFEDIFEGASKLADQMVDAASDTIEKAKKSDAFKVAADAVGKARDGASTAFETGKKKVEEINLNKDLEKAQRQLGALVYALAKTGEKNDMLVKQYVDDITAIENKIEELKKSEEDFSIEDIEKAADEMARSVEEDLKTGEEKFADMAEEAKDTRAEIKDYAADTAQGIKVDMAEAASDIKDSAEEAAEKLKENISDGVETLKDDLEDNK